MEYSFIPILPGPLWPRLILLESYLWICSQIICIRWEYLLEYNHIQKKLHKKCKCSCTWFLNLLVWNNHRLVDMLLELIIYVFSNLYAWKNETEFNKFKFKVFLFLNWLLYEDWRALSALRFTHRWRDNSWIHTFPKGIIVKCKQLHSGEFHTLVWNQN